MYRLWTDFNSKSPTGLYAGHLPGKTYDLPPKLHDRVVLFDDDGLELEGEIVEVKMGVSSRDIPISFCYSIFLVLVDEGASVAGDS